jgi:hypothetical protein
MQSRCNAAEHRRAQHDANHDLHHRQRRDLSDATEAPQRPWQQHSDEGDDEKADLGGQEGGPELGG